MFLLSQRLWCRILLCAMLGLTAACQSQSSSPPVPSASVTPAESPATPQTNEARVYRSDRFNLSFSYPADFAVGEKESGVEVWTAEDDRAIAAGEYEKGTELPPNIIVSVYPNAERLPLLEWLKREGNVHFGILKGDYTKRVVADREAIAFRSEGLYQHKNVVLSNPEGTEIIALRKEELNAEYRDAENDAAYQRAFEQILSSFWLDQ
jgi:hypothetical protein